MKKSAQFFGALLLSLPLYATTFIMKTDDEKIIESTRICAVEVLSVDKHIPKKRLFAAMTSAMVKPIECFKDATAKDFLVIWPGGPILDEKGKPTGSDLVVPGTPDLKPGQKAILYLWRETPSDEFVVHSWINGVVNIEWSAKDNDYIIQRRPMGLAHKSPAHSKASTQRNADPQTRKSFREKVQKVLEAQPNKK